MVDFIKEEAWLNEMASKGLAFQDYFLGRYTFVDCEPGEYIYRIELLDGFPGGQKSREYLKFMTDNGVEYVARWARWVYFRKPAAEGSFDIYTDVDSQINHYRRIARMFLVAAIIELIAALAQVPSVVLNLPHFGEHGSTFMGNLPLGISLLTLSMIFFVMYRGMRTRVRDLERKKDLQT
jgi:hypothetical protein